VSPSGVYQVIVFSIVNSVRCVCNTPSRTELKSQHKPGKYSLQCTPHTTNSLRANYKTGSKRINVPMRRVRVTTTVVEKNKYCIIWVCVFSFRYPSRKAHALYYIVICGLCGCTLLFHIICWTSFSKEKKIEHKMCVSTFSKAFVSSISRSKKNWERWDQ
jgi:hypothetical protein